MEVCMRHFRSHPLFALLLWGWLLLPVSGLFAQSFTADILGIVKDTSGGLVPGASLSLTEVGTGQVLTATSAAAGDYSFSALQPGRYRLEVSKSGFQTKTISDIVLLVGQHTRIDVLLAVGAVMQTVEVSAGGVQMLETQTSQAGQVVQERPIVQLPLNGRNFIQLATLAPGVYPTSSNNNGFSCANFWTGGGGSGGGSIAAMGLRESNVSYLIDGIETRGARWGNVTVKPGPDAIQEFKMETSNFEADSGRSAIITNISLKSGSDSFHGSAFEFIRNASLDANNFFLNESGQPRPPFQQNNWGASLGGPVRRDKVFFFAAYEALRSRKGTALNGLYPSAAQLQGNLADDSAGTGIYPKASAFCTANPGSSKCADVINPFTGQVLPGNVIPPGMLDPQSQKWIQYIRPINVAVTPGQPSLPPFNVILSPKELNDDNQYHGRVDYNVGEKDRFFASYSYDDRPHTVPNFQILNNQSYPWRGQVVATNWVHTFSPTLVNQLNAGYARSHNAFLAETANGPNIAQDVFGIKNVEPYPIGYGVPQALVAGFSCVGTFSIPQDSLDRTYQFTDNVSLVRGRHTLKFGGTYRHEKYYFLCACLASIQFTFNGQFSHTGLADMLLGIPSSEYAAYGVAILESRADYFGEYFQDDFRVRPDLTLNLGVRYETQQWPRDINGREETFLPSAGKVVAVFRNEIRNGIAKTPHLDFGPRVGFAYSPSYLKNTTVRASFGIFYATDNWNEFGSFAAFGPDFIVARAPTSNPTTPTLFMHTALPAVTLGGPLPPGTGIFATDPSNTIPYTQEWLFDIQHTFGPNWLLDVGYMGSVSQHLFQRRDENLPAIDPTGTIPLSARRPYPQYDFILTSYTGGWGDFNGLLAKVERRVTTNGYFLGSFTYSKALDLGNCCNWQGINRDFKVRNRGPSDGTVPLRLSLSYVWELPIGRGKRWFTDTSGAAEKLIGGWSLNGITTFASGPYTTPVLGFDYPVLGAFTTSVPNKIGPAIPSKQTITSYWNASGYALPGCPAPVSLPPCATAVHVDGNAQRNSLEDPGTNNWDIALLKNTQLNERVSLQFRAEFFNAFNHAQFGPPNNNLISGSFGVITNVVQPPREIQFGLKLLF